MNEYCVIALDNPKKGPNLAGILKAAAIFGVNLVIIRGGGIKSLEFMSETVDAWVNLPQIQYTDANLTDVVPHGCKTVAVEITENAIDLPHFTHPQKAMYIFGRENATLGKKVLDSADYIVKIPTRRYMNLAAVCNVLLYDRLSKELQREGC